MNIVAFKLSPLGDTVMFLPVVQAVRREHPDWRVTVFVTPTAAPLLRGTIPSKDIVVMETEQLRRAWRRPWQLVRAWWNLRWLRPDAVLLSYDQPSVARFLAATSGARVRVAGAGAAIHWQGGATHIVKKAPAHSLARWDWEMGRQMMTAFEQPWAEKPPAPLLPISPVASSPPRRRPRVIVHPGASRPYQRWQPERFAALAAALVADHEVIWIVRPEVVVEAPPGVRCAAPADVGEFLQLAVTADLFIGNHSGAFHLSAALGLPCVIIAGPSPFFCDPPWHAECRRILRAPDLPCLPCDRLTVSAGCCRNLTAPMACMVHWSVETVAAACRDTLRASVRRTAGGARLRR